MEIIHYANRYVLVDYWNLFCSDRGLKDKYEISYAIDIESLLEKCYRVSRIEDLHLTSAVEFNKALGKYDGQGFYWYDHDNKEIIWLNSALDKDSPVVRYDYHNEFIEYATTRFEGEKL